MGHFIKSIHSDDQASYLHFFPHSDLPTIHHILWCQLRLGNIRYFVSILVLRRTMSILSKIWILLPKQLQVQQILLSILSQILRQDFSKHCRNSAGWNRMVPDVSVCVWLGQFIVQSQTLVCKNGSIMKKEIKSYF